MLGLHRGRAQQQQQRRGGSLPPQGAVLAQLFAPSARVPAARARPYPGGERRRSLPPPPPAAGSPSLSRSSPGGAGVVAVGGLVPGWTRAEIFSARTPVLTARLQSELGQCASRVAEDAPQHLHSLRQIDDMVQEAISRWRRSTSLALSSITTLEEEATRKGDAARELAGRLAEKDAALASLEGENTALRLRVQRLEAHVRRAVEAVAGELGVFVLQQGGSGGVGGREVPLLCAALAGALQDVESYGAPPPPLRGVGAAAIVAAASASSGGAGSDADGSINGGGLVGSGGGSPLSADVAQREREMAGLRSAVAVGLREGTTDTVRRYFDELGGGAAAAAAAVRGSVQPPPSRVGALGRGRQVAPPPQSAAATTLSPAQARALRHADATMRRALEFAGSLGRHGPSLSPSPPSPRVPVASAAPVTPAAPLVLEIHFEPALHARATVAHLKAAVEARLGRKPFAVGVAGRILRADAQRLLDAGVGVFAQVEVHFAPPPAPVAAAAAAAPAGRPRAQPLPIRARASSMGSPSPSSPLVGPASPSAIARRLSAASLPQHPAAQQQQQQQQQLYHVTQPALPMAPAPRRKSPVPARRPLPSPQSHRAPIGLGAFSITPSISAPPPPPPPPAPLAAAVAEATAALVGLGAGSSSSAVSHADAAPPMPSSPALEAQLAAATARALALIEAEAALSRATAAVTAARASPTPPVAGGGSGGVETGE